MSFMDRLKKTMDLPWIREYREKGYTVEFSVACHDEKLIPGIQLMSATALAFKSESGSKAVQLESIVLALRVLRRGDVAALIDVYTLITGEKFVTDKNGINEVAKVMLFILPACRIDTGEIYKLNRIIERNILNAL